MTNLRLFHKYIIVCAFAVIWTAFSIWIASNWFENLVELSNIYVAVFAVYGVAIIPGFMTSFVFASLLLDRRPKNRRRDDADYPNITILIAAYNEAANIADTIKSIAIQHYPASMRVIVVNDGSKDRTAELVRELMTTYSWLDLIDLKTNVGKSHALNAALNSVETELAITVDGDSFLHKNAIINLVSRYLNDPPNTAAVAGSVLLRSSRENIVTKIQEWDYFLGIAAIKRVQSMYKGTLVAQGAFSLYRTDVLKEIQGWPHCVGEDIVLTWAMLRNDYRIGYAEDAILLTNAPNTWSQFIKQRQRWSRGLVEAFKAHWKLLFKRRMTTLFIWWNLFFPWLDLAYTFIFVPGLILACFGIYWVVGLLTLAILPISFSMNYLIYKIQSNTVKSQGLNIRGNFLGAMVYIFFYSVILQPACVWGYLKEIFFGATKNWGTK